MAAAEKEILRVKILVRYAGEKPQPQDLKEPLRGQIVIGDRVTEVVGEVGAVEQIPADDLHRRAREVLRRGR